VTDPAAEFRIMYLAMCDACVRAGIPAPTPDEWVDRLDEMIVEAMRASAQRNGGAVA